VAEGGSDGIAKYLTHSFCHRGESSDTIAILRWIFKRAGNRRVQPPLRAVGVIAADADTDRRCRNPLGNDGVHPYIPISHFLSHSHPWGPAGSVSRRQGPLAAAIAAHLDPGRKSDKP
jgi:hypothetical protein